jgi:protein ImuA
MLAKTELIKQLQKDILLLQGMKSPSGEEWIETGLSFMNEAFPTGCFPFSAVHEFVYDTPEEKSASFGFIAGVLSSLLKRGGITVWISRKHNVFPPALVAFGLQPENILFLHLRNEKEMLWAVEETLKCDGLTAVVGELSNFDFTASRRFQLAVESSKVSCFLLRQQPRNLTTASLARWHISPLQSQTPDGLPGIGFPRWKVELLKVRNGTPGTWEVEWKQQGFHQVRTSVFVETLVHKKAG